ncbi:MAG: hypothetical protein IIA66_12650 [Planctomycetes bacterium]|nr:hypothetical protein [Planctomycetota bacterium]
MNEVGPSAAKSNGKSQSHASRLMMRIVSPPLTAVKTETTDFSSPWASRDGMLSRARQTDQRFRRFPRSGSESEELLL